MSEQVYSLSVNKKTGELLVQPEKRRQSDSVGQEFKRIIDQQQQSKYLTLGLILSFLAAFVIIALFKDDMKFCVGLIVLTIAAIMGYIVVNYIDHLNIKYIMDTIRKIIHQTPEIEEDNEQEKIEKPLGNNLQDDKKKKKNVYF